MQITSGNYVSNRLPSKATNYFNDKFQTHTLLFSNNGVTERFILLYNQAIHFCIMKSSATEF